MAMSIPTAPLRAKTANISAADPDDARKAPDWRITQRLRVSTTPDEPDERGECDDDEKIDADHNGQRDHHRGPPPSGNDRLFPQIRVPGHESSAVTPQG